MMEYTVDEENKPRRLSSDEAAEIAARIGAMFDDYDRARAKQITIRDCLKPEIYLDNRSRSDGRNKDDAAEKWKSDVHLNKLYSLFDTRQAFVWDNIYANIEQMFDVEGKDEESEQAAKLQKAALVNDFYNMNIQQKLDKAIEYSDSVGEAVLFVSWKRKTKRVRRPLEEATVNPEWKTLRVTGSYAVFEVPLYDGPDVTAVNPIDLVFDPKTNPDDTEEWDTAAKIIKSWKTYNSIKTNRLYRLSADDREALKNMIDATVPNDRDTDAVDKTKDVVDGDRLEVLDFWGDFALKNGTFLKNWHITVIARQFVAVFEDNPLIFNPIINVAMQRDVDNKRGIPRLYSAYALAMEQEHKANLENDAQALNLNPPSWVPRDVLENRDKKEIRLFPGRIIEYDLGMVDPNMIIPMRFTLINNENTISFLDSAISSASGVFPNMQGQEESGKASATEIKVKFSGQTTRLSKDIDAYKQNMIVPMVTKVAELSANMRSGVIRLLIDDRGSKFSAEITDAVRWGNYKYKYTDSSGLQKKLQSNEKMMQILTPVWNDQSVMLNKTEIIKTALENADFNNPDKFFSQPAAINQMPAEGQAQTLPETPGGAGNVVPDQAARQPVPEVA